ncbi:DUF4913 domain-containing protein [Gordonia pseudamarae]|jgi:hypothetical protein|uniref:DUF4913 domain-containing protein n=1 Tax=Gordonia pseudamarae TaxID=2831662 RepID=UPI001AF81055|nr:DUF4913 domain-containing protein [Gordonia pseudamarae]QHN28965.1 DUF4913 domain-containing protein [Gordonia pseudamarae]
MNFDDFPEFDESVFADDLTPSDPTADSEQEPQLEYPSVYDYVEKHLIYVYQRKIVRNSTYVWCPQWWLHAEAVSRLEALWRAWESLRQDPTTGMSVWWRDHADPHMHVLMDPNNGPFWCCSVEGGHHSSGEQTPIPVEIMPDAAVRAAMSAY